MNWLQPFVCVREAEEYYLHDEVDEKVTVVTAKALDPVLLDHKERIRIDAKTQLLNDRLPKPFACELFPVVAESACLYASQSYVVVPLSSCLGRGVAQCTEKLFLFPNA